ncbi:Holliday junction DNA helicase subunit RuvA [Thermosyntropha lipolytica DSM 11003]|uniref:Holliday junction branch migration complex subunit RuvA n=1 Tax=Thermosyntropha lipolytica DSM 11003 TaxID=1123382 RepID=A0A1M5P9W8_9FIRM|nr:Holliday junction branch migration protein RuvA [Thermosyntropha lipolytica]SHG98560.1 Holliday junction DNA helicase subunit RuvA [Thermosyntropha lipolytica DSM 11003]
MVSFLRGRLAFCEEDAVVIDVGGVGYTVYVHKRSFREMPPPGDEIFIYTCMQVMENEFRLYGFLHREERELFKRLITVSGMGAKSALSILGAAEPAAFYQAVINGDEKFLTSLPGIGKKTAQRLIFELKEKLWSLGSVYAGEENGERAAELVEVLEALGYKRSEFYPLLHELKRKKELTGCLEEDLKKVLRFINQRQSSV